MVLVSVICVNSFDWELGTGTGTEPDREPVPWVPGYFLNSIQMGHSSTGAEDGRWKRRKEGEGGVGGGGRVVVVSQNGWVGANRQQRVPFATTRCCMNVKNIAALIFGARGGGPVINQQHEAEVGWLRCRPGPGDVDLPAATNPPRLDPDS